MYNHVEIRKVKVSTMELTNEELVEVMDSLSVDSFGECFTGITIKE